MSELEHGEGHVTSSDGLRLYWQRWMPKEPKAILLFVHGLGEHSGRYAHVADYFGSRGFGCYGLDYRSHGKSPGLRVHVDDFAEYLDDLTAMREHLGEAHPDLPRFVVGHSQGGLVTLAAVLANAEGLAGAVVSSPFLGVHPSSQPNAAVAAIGKVISKLLPRLRLDNGLDSAMLSHDKAVVEAYDRDPLVTGKVSARWFTEILTAHERTVAGASRLSLPTLMMVSGDDRIVDPEASRRFARGAPKELLELVEWEGLYHEMFNEPEQEQVFERMERWLEERLEKLSE